MPAYIPAPCLRSHIPLEYKVPPRYREGTGRRCDIFSWKSLVLGFSFSPPVTELSLSLGVGIAPEQLFKGLGDSRGYFGLTRLELQAPRMGLGDLPQAVAIQALAGAVIHMSLLIHLSIPEDFVTESLLLHISLLPRLETLVIASTPLAHRLSGGECEGFPSLRSLDVPDEILLHRFLSYPVRNLESLRVKDIGQKSLPAVARKLPNLRQLSIGGQGFTSPEIFVLGACFQLEEISIIIQDPPGTNDLNLHQFRAMFRNLWSLTIVTRDPFSNVEFCHTRHRRDVADASWVVEANGVGRRT